MTSPDANSGVTPLVAPQAAATVQTAVEGLLGAVQKITIDGLTVGSGSVVDIQIGEVQLGGATIGQLLLQGANFDITSGSAHLEQVQVVIKLDFTLFWWVDVGLVWYSHTDGLGSLSVPIDVGDVLVPSLDNLTLAVPTIATTAPVEATVSPLTGLDFGGGTFSGLSADNLVLPARGFQLTGLGITGMGISSVQVPQATAATATVQDFHPNHQINLPSVQIPSFSFPAVQAPDIHSTGASSFQVNSSPHSLHPFDFIVFGGQLTVNPTAYISVGALHLQSVGVKGSVPATEIHNISMSVDARGINVRGITVGPVDVSGLSIS